MTVFANGRSILHKGHGQTQMAIAPDVCKTPSPGGPVPIPYPNMSSDSNLTDGAATVKIKGNPAANTGSKLSRSNGDEAGTAGGVVSSKNMGAFGWPAGSIDVQAEGKGVIRMLDSSLTNGNAYNDTGMNVGQTGLGYGDDAECPRDDCKLGRVLAKHRVPETHDMELACEDFAGQVGTGLRGHLKKSRAGRMVGVGICECGQKWKAVSGPPIPATNPMAGQAGFCNDVAPMAGDAYMGRVMGLNPEWSCAALKILSNASGHKIVALSEKWVGKEVTGGGRRPKTFSTQNFTFPVNTSGGFGVAIPAAVSDRIPGAPEGSIPSGGSVPSCGTCQTFLPALVCEMKPCA
jgi:uncharacterized Zn-binding protein involved in type VI secretion